MSRPAAAPDPSAAPARAPVACGALGAYDWRRVARIGEALGVPMRQVHEDDASILLLDREFLLSVLAKSKRASPAALTVRLESGFWNQGA